MKKRLVVKNLPIKVPVSFTMVLFLYLDYYNMPGWLFGVVGVIMAIVWIIIGIDQWNLKRINLFPNGEELANLDSLSKEKSKFQEKLEKMKEERENTKS